jgi:hypothetical protein
MTVTDDRAQPLTTTVGPGRPAVEDLAPISLEDLIRQAPLMSRLDRKYLLPVAAVPRLLTELSASTQVLQIGQNRQFRYRSVYFDTVDLRSYHSTAYRRRQRFKVRTRSYLDSDLHVLELKTRRTRGITTKQRAPYAGDGCTLDPADHVQLQELLDENGVAVTPDELAPVLITRYVRTTLFSPGSLSRVTVDADLTWDLVDGPSLALPSWVIVEVKSTRASCDADRLLWSMGHRPCSVSKYGTGLAALRPDLPSHHWARLIRRHFDGVATGPGSVDGSGAQARTVR